MNIFSHVNAKNTQKGLRISQFLLLLVVFKWRHGSERVKGLYPVWVWGSTVVENSDICDEIAPMFCFVLPSVLAGSNHEL